MILPSSQASSFAIVNDILYPRLLSLKLGEAIRWWWVLGLTRDKVFALRTHSFYIHCFFYLMSSSHVEEVIHVTLRKRMVKRGQGIPFCQGREVYKEGTHATHTRSTHEARGKGADTWWWIKSFGLVRCGVSRQWLIHKLEQTIKSTDAGFALGTQLRSIILGSSWEYRKGVVKCFWHGQSK